MEKTRARSMPSFEGNAIQVGLVYTTHLNYAYIPTTSIIVDAPTSTYVLVRSPNLIYPQNTSV